MNETAYFTDLHAQLYNTILRRYPADVYSRFAAGGNRQAALKSFAVLVFLPAPKMLTAFLVPAIAKCSLLFYGNQICDDDPRFGVCGGEDDQGCASAARTAAVQGTWGQHDAA